MLSSTKIKSVDFYRKIPRDLTEASLSGAGLSIIAALAMMFLFGMELNNYLTVTTSTAVIVDRSTDGDFLRIDFNISFPSLSCEFASVDVSDVLGTFRDIVPNLSQNRLNITKTIRKFSIDKDLRPTGSEFHSVPALHFIKHGEEVDEGSVDSSIRLTAANFDSYTHQYPILAVNFYAPWCYWSKRLMLHLIFYIDSCIDHELCFFFFFLSFFLLSHYFLFFQKPSWENAAKMIKERYDPELDGRILLGKVDCTEEIELCKRNHIQAYPSIRIFRKGSDISLDPLSTDLGSYNYTIRLIGFVIDDHGHHDHESYYGDRDTESLVKTMEGLVAPIPVEGSQKLALEDKHNNTAGAAKRPAPLTGGCRIEGYVRVKKVPGNLIISARSVAHSFDTTQMNMSHVISHLSFGRKISPHVLSDVKRMIPYLGGSHDRLNGRSFINHRELGANVTIEHYLQIVKTEVMMRKHFGEISLLEEYEYTAHSSLSHSVYIPAAKFHIELSPMQVVVSENPKSFSHFITNVCAIIGGVFTVAGILDSILHNTIRLIKKVELGKNF
ncbi:hypothetical protein EZV62_009138 [Acer yangbiense]|uniref:Thioredoxin domain-containing protein n=1 Tax=Acer yangbiense TaxID=1000413 RepID=A0A5C7IF63_9ROSI|nr:hypothetical protein EZV62_009138 [Acer yangbiense]